MTPGQKVYRRKGVLQNSVQKNCNGRIYPESIWKRVFSEGSKFMNRLKSRSVLGLLEHPKDGVTRLDLGPAILITEVHCATADEIKADKELVEGDIVGEFEILDTHAGKELQALDKANVTYGVSSRGTGTVREDSGAAIVNDDFDLDTWDVVYNPSVERALPKRVESVEPQKPAEPIKKEGTTDERSAEDGSSAASETVVVEHIKPSHPMSNKLNEMRTLEAQITSLTCTNVKGLKAHAKASLLNTVIEQRVAIDRLVVEDPALKTLAYRLQKRLNEFEDDISMDDAPPAPAAPAPEAAPAPAAAVTNDELVDEPEDELLRKASELLKQNCPEDPEAAEIAGKLDDLAAEKDPDAGEDLDPNAVPGEDAPPAPVSDAPAPGDIPQESKVKKTKTYRTLETRHKSLLRATGTILERYHALKKSTQAEGFEEDGTAPRTVAVKLLGEKKALEQKCADWEKTSRDLAERYNTDMIQVGTEHWKLKRPELFEKSQDRLKAAKTFEEFEQITADILKEAGVSEAESAKKPTTEEAAPAPEKGKAELAEEVKTSEAKKTPEAVVESVEAPVHPQIAHARRARQNGSKYRSA